MKRSPVRLLLSVVLGLGLAAVTFSMGNWQVRRAAEKTALHQQQAERLHAPAIDHPEELLDLQKLAYRRLKLQGHFVPDAVVYIDNRQIDGRPAVQVIQAFQPEGANYVVPVDRGLLPRNPDQPRMPPPLPMQAAGADANDLLVTVLPGFARSAELWGLTLGGSKKIHRETDEGRQVWSNFDAAEFGKWLGRPVSNYVATVEPVLPEAQDMQTSGQATASGFYMDQVSLPDQVARHRGYAIQWYAMTAMLLLFSGYFVFKEFKSRND